jgi:hypothetical protein
MAKQKNSSFVRRLFGKDQEPEIATTAAKGFVCQPSKKDPNHFYRYKMVGGSLEQVDGFPYESYESCMGIAVKKAGN